MFFINQFYTYFNCSYVRDAKAAAQKKLSRILHLFELIWAGTLCHSIKGFSTSSIRLGIRNSLATVDIICWELQLSFKKRQTIYTPDNMQYIIYQKLISVLSEIEVHVSANDVEVCHRIGNQIGTNEKIIVFSEQKTL